MALDNKVDVFERDLMLSYIRQLEEAFAPAETTKVAPKSGIPLVEKIPAAKAEVKRALKAVAERLTPSSTSPKPRKRRSWAFPSPTDSGPATKITASLPDVKKYKPVVKKTPKPAPAPAPIIPAPKPVTKKATKAVAEKPRPSATKATPTKAKVEAKPAPTPAVKAPYPVPSIPGIKKPKKSSNGFSKSDYEELLDFTDAKELLEIRSQMPIKDLTKVMLSREKKSAINTLFGGDSKAFDATLKTLNTFKSYSQAKTYLSDNIAAKYNWLDKSRKDQVSDFIVLVRRRYN
jgi:hypothetical protein